MDEVGSAKQAAEPVLQDPCNHRQNQFWMNCVCDTHMHNQKQSILID